MLFRHDHAAGFRSRREDGSLIERLHGIRVDNLRLDSLFGQMVGRNQRFVHFDTARNDGHVGAFAQRPGSADLQGAARFVDAGDGSTAHAHVHRSRRLRRQLQRGNARIVVRRHEHAHVRQHAHERNVLEHLMAAAVRTDGNARMRRGNLDVQVRIADRIANLVVNAPRTEHSKGARERHVARQGQTSRHVDHVLFGNADVEKAGFVLFCRRGELLRRGGTGQVGVDGHDRHARHRKLRQSRAEGSARRFLLSCHVRPPSCSGRTGQSPALQASALCHAIRPGPPCSSRLCPSSSRR